MEDMTKSVLVVGFNTRPLAYSLRKAGYDVYAVDFFGDLDLYPHVKDSLILIRELDTNYSSIKSSYSELLSSFTLKMLRKYPDIDYLIIGSGLDDAYKEREDILSKRIEKNYKIRDLNNEIETIRKARNIKQIYEYLKFNKFNVPISIPYQRLKFYEHRLVFPIIFKRFKSAGGLNIFKIRTLEELNSLIKSLSVKNGNLSDWLIQEYIEGIPVSCTTISNGKESIVISINRQIIGEPRLNPPKEFIYCGNTVPGGLSKKDDKLISKISIFLANKLGLRGINGFDYVLRDHYPYLMEINPRIPGSIRASEVSLDLNLLNLHVKSFDLNQWDSVKKSIKSKRSTGFTTKLIFFAPKEIREDLIVKINNLEYIHDQSEPNKNILKGEPLCTVLYKAHSFSESYNGAHKVITEIIDVIGS
ncbi:MAG: ATP-grasp domain-containing protein [Promethearchaeota archaeon]|jgi:predicted ATP-grasp superfamily ATP-dependent carboligase